MRSSLLASLSVLSLAVLVGASACTPLPLPMPPAECDADGKGCLSDERCVEGRCVPLEKCEGDADCPSAAWRCVFPAQICELRPGFGEECAVASDCGPGFACSLGRCRDLSTARTCANTNQCPIGQACDRTSFICIEEAPCTLEPDFPEVACGPGEVCEAVSGRCMLPCQNQCTPDTEVEDCGVGYRCDGACRCVQCITAADCGPGLVCNLRSGNCESENLCRSDDDCAPPLICDPRTALCQVPPPPCETDFDCEIAEICNRTTGVCEPIDGPCIDDRFENADTPATAETLRVSRDGTPRLVDDLMLCPDDDDVYAIELLAGDNLVVRVMSTLASARATVWLLDSEGETSLRYAEAPPFGNGTISYVAQRDETVYIRVNALSGQTPYDMELLVLPGTPCQPDPFEGATGNDTPETATPEAQVPTGVTLVGSLCPGDEDYLRVHLGAGEGLDARLAFNEASADFDLLLYDADTGALLASSSGVRSPEEIRYRTFSERTVLVNIRPFGPSDGPWQLTLTRLPERTCEPDAREPDNTRESATLLGPEDAILDEERTLCGADVDVYEVPLLDFERLVAIATFPTAELALSMRVVKEDGTVARVSPDSSGGETLTYAASGDETVWLEIAPELGAEGPYTLSLFRENQLTCAPDDFEPNDVVADAAPAPAAASGLTLCGSDQDLFRVEGAAGKQLRARASFLHADGDIDVMILGSDGQQILGVSDGVGNVEQAEAILPLDGIYYVRVFSLSASIRSRYSLEISLENPD